MKTVVVLGTSGMLGSMVRFRLERNRALRVVPLARPAFDAEEALRARDVPQLDGADYVVNCVGIIKPYCKDDDAAGVERAIRINAHFPHELARAAARRGARLIQIATDCVYSGARGEYSEADAHDALDVYGKTKSLGELHVPGALNVRCSIIGPEAGRATSLLEWFLAQPENASLNGFAHHRWNGVTTLQFARLCERIVERDAFDELAGIAPLLHFLPNEPVSKYELLGLMAEAFGRTVEVRRVDDVGPPVDRTLTSRYDAFGTLFPPESQRASLAELAAVLPEYRRFAGPAAA